MFEIFFLKFTETAIRIIPRAKRLYNEHYVLAYKSRFFVMTSKPVEGLKNTYIHHTNVENQEGKDQYVVENMHHFDSKIHIFEHTTRGAKYLAEHKEKFQPVLDELSKEQ